MLNMLSFDFSSFVTSVSGICIIIGICLVVIGIIILLCDKNKKNNNAPTVQTDANTEASAPVDSAPVTTEEKKEEISKAFAMPNEHIEEEKKEEVPQVFEENPVNVDSPSTLETEPVLNEAPVSNDAINTNPAEVKEENTNLEATINIGDALPVLESAVPTENVVENTPVVTAEPVIINEPENVTPVINTEPSVTAYGGANPEENIDKESLVEKPREIYGGADPLENTRPVPTDNIKEAYSGASLNVPANETFNASVVEPEPAPAVIETPVEIPAEAVPSINIAPEVEEVKEEVVNATPVITPAVEEEEIEKLDF